MKTYEGGRSLDGAVVTVDGAPLDPRFDIHRFSRTGFESGSFLKAAVPAAPEG